MHKALRVSLAAAAVAFSASLLAQVPEQGAAKQHSVVKAVAAKNARGSKATEAGKKEPAKASAMESQAKAVMALLLGLLHGGK